MDKPRRLTGLALLLASLILIADQITKEWVRRLLDGSDLAITSFFNLVTAWNRGVAFSLFRQHNDAGKWLLIAISLIVCVMLARWLQHIAHRLPAVGIGLILGGAIGNVVDRLRFSAVFDFLDFYWDLYHWPAFNLADSAIVTGIACLMAEEVVSRRQKR